MNEDKASEDKASEAKANEAKANEAKSQQVDERVLSEMKAGNSQAFQVVVDAFFPRLVQAAEKRIAKNRQRITDGDDVAASVFESLWSRADRGQFAADEIPDEEALWRFLQRVMASKITDHMRRESATKRGGGNVRGESVFVNAAVEQVGGLGDHQPQMSVEDLAELEESERSLLNTLPNDMLREIAISRMEGFEVKEIAEKLGISDRSVKRKLAIIRETWQQFVDGTSED